MQEPISFTFPAVEALSEVLSKEWQDRVVAQAAAEMRRRRLESSSRSLETAAPSEEEPQRIGTVQIPSSFEGSPSA